MDNGQFLKSLRQKMQKKSWRKQENRTETETFKVKVDNDFKERLQRPKRFLIPNLGSE